MNFSTRGIIGIIPVAPSITLSRAAGAIKWLQCAFRRAAVDDFERSVLGVVVRLLLLWCITCHTSSCAGMLFAITAFGSPLPAILDANRNKKLKVSLGQASTCGLLPVDGDGAARPQCVQSLVSAPQWLLAFANVCIVPPMQLCAQQQSAATASVTYLLTRSCCCCCCLLSLLLLLVVHRA